MTVIEIIFLVCLFLAFYTYIGYGIVLGLVLKIKQLVYGKPEAPRFAEAALPQVSLVIAAYNEADILEEKIANCLVLNYPKGKLTITFVTDGSTDKGPEIISGYPELKLLHEPARNGKIAAINRAMKLVDTPITVFTDANTYLSENAILDLVHPFADPSIGAVAGEKYIRADEASAEASGKGEGLYWEYESLLKRMDAQLYSVVGAAGELYAIRTALFQEFEPDTLLDDFMLTLRIAMDGKRVSYRPEARAEEYPSSSLAEELKRKVRICAGGIQSIVRLGGLLNPFKYGVLSFQYISHRVLRWTITPIALLLLLPLNVVLAVNGGLLYTLLLIGQIVFYAMAYLGYRWQNRKVNVPGFFVPLYFCLMNYSVFAGFSRYMAGKQSVNWEKAKRAEAIS
ncbi:MAG: glycosyltransferase family 2 protein [Bacteroidota bacterium]